MLRKKVDDELPRRLDQGPLFHVHLIAIFRMTPALAFKRPDFSDNRSPENAVGAGHKTQRLARSITPRKDRPAARAGIDRGDGHRR